MRLDELTKSLTERAEQAYREQQERERAELEERYALLEPEAVSVCREILGRTPDAESFRRRTVDWGGCKHPSFEFEIDGVPLQVKLHETTTHTYYENGEARHIKEWVTVLRSRMPGTGYGWFNVKSLADLGRAIVEAR